MKYLGSTFLNLTTKFGADVGRGQIRSMVNKVGGMAIAKSFTTMPDGTRAMLATKGGMPRLFAEKKTGGCDFTLHDSSPGDSWVRHLVQFDQPVKSTRTMRVKFRGITAHPGADFTPEPADWTPPQDGIRFTPTSVIVSPGITNFYIYVYHSGGHSPPAPEYEITVACRKALGSLPVGG